MGKAPGAEKWLAFQGEALKKRLFIIAAFIFVGLIVWSSVAFQQIFDRYVSVISLFSGAHPFLGSLIFIGLAAVSALLSLFSSVPLVPLAVAVFGQWPTALFLLLGWMLGGVGAYLVGASAGHAAVKYFVSLEEVEYYRRKLDRRSGFWLIVAFRLALPAEITGYTLGTARYHFGKFALATFISEIPFVILAVFSSQALLDRRFGLFLALIVFGLVLMLGMFRWIQGRMDQ